MGSGEELALRVRLRQMEARQASVQRCGIVRMGLVGDDGSSGVQEGLRSVQTQLNAVLADEEAYAAVRAGGRRTFPWITSNGLHWCIGEGSPLWRHFPFWIYLIFFIISCSFSGLLEGEFLRCAAEPEGEGSLAQAARTRRTGWMRRRMRGKAWH